MAKEIKDYLHLYIGCRVRYTGMANDRILTATWLGSLIKTNAWQNIKPILRPLPTMTKKEAKKNGFWSTIHNMIVGVNERHVRYNLYSAKQIIWLLSEGFDIFGLIESGLAIDKNELNNKK
jgi:hypothetical protein